jgi:hypothetical protein
VRACVPACLRECVRACVETDHRREIVGKSVPSAFFFFASTMLMELNAIRLKTGVDCRQGM